MPRPLTGRPVGRPMGDSTHIVTVRIPTKVYDRYCQEAWRHDVAVTRVMRRVLSAHAPSTDREPT